MGWNSQTEKKFFCGMKYRFLIFVLHWKKIIGINLMVL